MSDIVKTEDTATNIIHDSLKEYGGDVISTKFPSAIDGCKDVIRRIIYSIRDQKEYKEFLAVVGSIMENHVSGDKSIIDATIRLSQPFMVGHPIVNVKGNNGYYHSPNVYSHPRYLKCSNSEFTRDIFYNGINFKTIPLVKNKDHSKMEPKYLIPKLPMSLVLGNLSVGYAFKSTIPMVDIHDVCDVVMKFSEYYQKGGIGYPPYKSIAKHLVPGYPIPGLVRNRQQLIDSYSRGDFTVPILSEGTCELTGNGMVLTSLPYGVDFARIANSLRSKHSGKDKTDLKDMITSANQYSSDDAEFLIEFKKGYNPFAVLDRLRSELDYNDSKHPIYNYTREGKVTSLNPVLVVKEWYTDRYLSIAGSLKYRQSDLIAQRMALEATLKICHNIDDVVSTIRGASNMDDAIVKIHDRFKKDSLTWSQAEIIVKQPLHVLSKASPEQLKEDINKINIDLENTLDNFGKIHEIIHNDAAFLKKKYASTKLTKYSDDFIGYVKFGDKGIINFFNYEEMYHILNLKGWSSNVVKSIHRYDPNSKIRYKVVKGRLVPLTNPSKEIACERIVEVSKVRNPYTLCISPDGASIISNDIVDASSGDYTLVNVAKSFYAIDRNGSVRLTDISEFAIRKNLTKGNKSSVIYAIPDNSKNIAVLHMCDEEPNTIRIDRILHNGGVGKLKTYAMGNVKILGAFPLDVNEIILNIPAECTKLLNMNHLFIYNLSSLFKNDKDNHHVIQLTRSTSRVKITRSPVVRSLYTMDLSSMNKK